MERDAVQRVIVSHREDAMRLAAIITGSQAWAEEAVHEAIVRAVAGLDSLKEPSAAWPWFRRIVVHEAIRTARAQGRFVPLEHEDALPDDGPPPEDALIDAEESAAAVAALRSLSPVLRAAVALRYLVGLGVGEAAAVLGVPTGTVKSRCAAARALLRHRIDLPVLEVVQLASRVFQHIRVAGIDFPFGEVDPDGPPTAPATYAHPNVLSATELHERMRETSWPDGWPMGLVFTKGLHEKREGYRQGIAWFREDLDRWPCMACQLHVWTPLNSPLTIFPSDNDGVRTETTIVDRPAEWIAQPQEHYVTWQCGEHQYQLYCCHIAPDRVRQLAEQLQGHIAQRP